MASHKAQGPIEQAEQALRRAHRYSNENALFELAAAERALQQALTAHVAALRKSGCSWQLIGQALEITPQAARKRFERSGL